MAICGTQSTRIDIRFAKLHNEWMNWEDARLFLAVARAGQMLGAARALGINQSTLSRRLTALETALDTKLLFRSTTGCVLTEQGHVLFEALEQAEGPILTAAAQVTETSVAMTGTVRIGAPDGFGVFFLAPRLGILSERHPGLRLELVPVSRAFSLSQREADIAILVGRPQKGQLVGKKLTDYTLGLYAAPDYLDRAGRPESIDDLGRHRLIGYVEDLIPTPELSFAADVSRDWANAVSISSAMGQQQAVRSGAGIGILHDYIAADDTGLTPVLPQIALTRSYWIAVHENLKASPQVRAVWSFVEAEVAAFGQFLREH